MEHEQKVTHEQKMTQYMVPENWMRGSTCNKSGISAYAPYIIDPLDNKVIIDTEWWNNLTQKIRDLLIQRLGDRFKLAKIIVPHKYHRMNELYDIIYNALSDAYDYNQWYQDNNICPPGVKMIRLSKEDKSLIRQMKLNDLNGLRAQIDEIIQDKQKYFVRTSSTSGVKRVNESNQYEVLAKPYDNTEEILIHLLSDTEFRIRDFSEDKDTYIIFVPWNPMINHRNVFRLFVVNRKLTCMSPKKWYQCHSYTQEEIFTIISTTIASNLYKESPYNTFVADIFIDFDKKTCNLIKFKCFGAFTGTRSVLFDWDEDYDLIHGIGDNLPEFRYIGLYLEGREATQD